MSEEKIIVDKELVFASPQRDISGIDTSSSGPEERLKPIQEGFVVHESAKTIRFDDVPVPDVPVPRSAREGQSSRWDGNSPDVIP